MRVFALVLIMAAMFAACDNEDEQEGAPLSTEEWTTLPPSEEACGSTEQALTVSDLIKYRRKHPVKVPAWAAPEPTCEQPTLRVANVGPTDDPEGEFLGIAATVTAGNCSVTVEHITFSLRMRIDGVAQAVGGPSDLLTGVRIAAGDPAGLPGGAPLADALTEELYSYPVGAYALAWSTYGSYRDDAVAVPAGESRTIGLFASLGTAAPATYLFSVSGASVRIGNEEYPREFGGPLFGLPFRVTEPPPAVCKQPFVSVWPLAPEDNTFGVSRKLIAEVFAPDCDLHLTRFDVSFRRVNDVEGDGGEQWALFSWSHLSKVETLDLAVGLNADPDEITHISVQSVEGLSGAVMRTFSSWEGIHVPAGDSAIFEIATSLDADILPGEYLLAVERVEGTVLDTDDDVQLYGLPAFGIPFTISE
ncbi:MAG: hypothetical protein Q7T01_02945 [bacterium]|nr:hypothetical protein [bacterium]